MPDGWDRLKPQGKEAETRGYAYVPGRRRSEKHFDVRSVDLHLIVLDAGGWVVHGDARLDVELPRMPRTGDDVAFQLAFTQRPSAMGAGIVDGIEGPIHIEHGHGLAIDFSHHP